MAGNILRRGNDAKILLTYYLNGRRVRQDVTIRYSDDDESYFAMPMPVNFVKPKNKSDIEITYRSSVGVLFAATKLVDCNMSLQEIIFTVKTPKIWEDRESRRSKRKETKFPVTIKINDAEYKTESYDFATGGVSVVANMDLSDSQKQLFADVTLEFNKGEPITVQGKFVREKDVYAEENIHLYVYKFLNVSNFTNLIIKNYLLSIE